MKFQAALAALVAAITLNGVMVAQEAPRATEPPSAVEPTLDPGVMAEQMSISAGKGINFSFSSQKPSASQLSGGVRLQYEQVIVAADEIDFSQSEFTDSKLSILSEGRLLAGPNGPTPERILFDTRETKLPRMGFRGMLTPNAAHINRMEPESPHSRLAAFRILLVGLGDFSGDLHAKTKWVPHEGWADHAVIEAVADVTEKGLANPRLRSIKFCGSEQPKRKAEIMRPAQQLKASTDPATAKAYDMKALGREITVQFDEQGELSNYNSGLDGEITGNPTP